VCLHCSGKAKEERKDSKSRKSTGSESVEKLSKRTESSKPVGVESRLMELSMAVPPGGDIADAKDVCGKPKTGSRGNRHQSDRSNADKVGLAPTVVDDTGTRQKTAAEPKEKSSSNKSQRKVKDTVAGSEKDKKASQHGRKNADGTGKRKQRSESTSSASSDSSSSSSSSSSGSSSSGSSSNTSSSSSAASSPKKPRHHATTKSKSTAQRSAGKTHQAKDPAGDKAASGKLSSKDVHQRPKKKSHGGEGPRGQSTLKEYGEGEGVHKVASETRKDSRVQSRRSGHEKKHGVEVSPTRRARDDELDQHGTPGSDRRLPHDSSSSLEYRQERVSSRYSSGGEHRRSGRYDAEEHYDRLQQHAVEFEMSDRYRAGRLLLLISSRSVAFDAAVVSLARDLGDREGMFW